MEAAIAAAERGHDVTLFEAADELGGLVPVASSADARRELGELVGYQADELKRLGVDVRLGTRAGADDLAGYDAVVPATGGTPRAPAFPVSGTRTLTPEDAVRSEDDWSGRTVVVVDDVAHFPAYLPAELLADRGATVVVATPKLSAGGSLDSASMMTMHVRLARKGVEFFVHQAVVDADSGRVRFRDTLSGVETVRRVDALVLAVGRRADDGLTRGLRERGVEVHPVGDCVAPRTITEAVREGRAAGRAV